MKKLKIIAGIIILLISGLFAIFFIERQNNKPEVLPDGTVVYNFSKQSQPKASKILYEFILDENTDLWKNSLDKNKKYKSFQVYAQKELKIIPEKVYAFEYDLNDDGKNEIIGYIENSAYRGTAGVSLFILQKNNNYYSNLVYILNFEPKLKFYILKNKTNGFKDIILYGSIAYNFSPMSIKYNGKFYYCPKQ